MGKIITKIANYWRECDKVLFVLFLSATCYGCVAVLSATHYTGSLRQFLMQFICMIIGTVAVIVISNFDYRNLIKYWPILVVLTVIPVLLTFVWGYAPEGTDDKAWLLIGGISFQPAELLKITFAVTFATHLSAVGDQINKLKNVVLLCLHAALPVALIHIQGDDGTALIFAIMFLGMMLAAGLKPLYWIIAGVSALVAAPFTYFVIMNDDQRTRIINMFDVNADLLGAGWQQWRGRIALANGGVFGQGLFKGSLTQVKNGVPEGYNDFIFVCIGEELGIIGCLAVVIILFAVCLRVLYVAKSTRDPAGTYMCVGIFSMLAGQIIINLGMCLSILPVIGVTLPFFSAGGTSLLCLYLSMGVVMNVYMHRSSTTIRIRDI